MSFDPKAYLANKSAGQFDPHAYLAAKAPGSSVENRNALEEVVRFLDTYTGAPARAGVDALLDGKEPISPIIKQFGQEPELAASARDLARKSGLSAEPILDPSNGYGNMAALRAGMPITADVLQALGQSDRVNSISPEDVGTAAYGVGADLTNLIPLLGAGKKVVGALRGAEEVGNAVKTGINLNKAEKVADTASKVSHLKSHAPEIIESAQTFNTKAIPGQLLKGKVQKAVSSILEESPTLVGGEYRKPVEKGVEEIQKFLSEALGNGVSLSEAQLGNKTKAALSSKIELENAPISELYNKIRESTQNIPVNPKSTKAITRNVGKLDEAALSPSSPAGTFAKRVQSELENVTSVEQLKKYRSVLRRQAQDAPAEVRAIHKNIDARLKALEEGTIVREGRNLSKVTKDQTFAIQAKKLIGERKAADAAYRSFIQKIERLADKVGANDEGAQSFISSLKGISPEKLTKRLLSKDDSEFLQFMMKEFPEEAKDIIGFQKSQLLKRHTVDRALNAGNLSKELAGMSPELQQMMFTPEQLQKLGKSRTYLESLPKKFNTSNTDSARVISQTAESPKGAALTNARDYVLKRFLESAQAGTNSPMELLSRGAKAAQETGRKALTPAERARRLLALERIDKGSTRPAMDRKNRLKAMGE